MYFLFCIIVFFVSGKECYTTKKYDYKGCFEFNLKNSLVTEFKENLNETIIPGSCVNICARNKFSFAGIENRECRCGNYVPTDIIRRSDLECNIPCPGNKLKKCGGSSKVSVYETGVKIKEELIPARVYIGCFKDDNPEFRVLIGSNDIFEDNSSEKCHKHCYSLGFKYFGLTYIQECFCGDTLASEESARSELECNSKCNGNPDEFCGGSWKLSFYATGITDIPETGRFVGCFKNPNNNEAKIEYNFELLKSNTNRRCLNICNHRHFKYSAVQNRTTCSCLNLLPLNSFLDDDYNCIKYDCPGDNTEKCGSKDRMRIFKTTHGDQNLGTQPKYIGCFQNKITFRNLEGDKIVLENSLTPNLCIDICKNRGFAFAGVEAGNICFCGHMYPSKYTKTDEVDCKNPCSGDKTINCGGPLRISVYATGFFRDQARVNRWYLGCYRDDDKDNRMLRGQWSQFVNNSPDICHKHCLKIGYKYFGVTWLTECFCGDEDPWEDLLLNDSHCSKQCKGDSNQKCGESWRLSVYNTGIYELPETDNYLGCFKNNGSILTNYKVELAWSNLPKRCTNICDQLGFAYAGVEMGIECRCGNMAPKIIPEAETKCNSNCPGWSGNKCGGWNYVRVFKTSIPEANVLSSDSNAVVDIKDNCKSTGTSHNRQNICKNESLLNEQFDIFNSSVWSYTIKMALDPDYEFVTYTGTSDVIYLKNGVLFIKPQIQSLEKIRNNLTLHDCTGKIGTEECTKTVVSSNIIPPILSAQISTKNSISFRFGRIEIRAKFPRGDWLVPEIWLTPKNNEYGQNYQSGQIRIAMIRGNKELICNDERLGNRFLQAGIYFGSPNAVKKLIFTKEMAENWLDNFHDFSLVWTIDNISFYVDGELISHVLKNSEDTVRSVTKQPLNSEYLWQDGSKLAPFDKEFYITLGVSVGGINDFPDNCVSNGVKKPWSNTSPKAMLNFWEKRNQWKSTWDSEEAALQVDHVRLNAL